MVVQAQGLPDDPLELANLVSWYPKFQPMRVDRHPEELAALRWIETGFGGDQEPQADKQVHGENRGGAAWCWLSLASGLLPRLLDRLLRHVLAELAELLLLIRELLELVHLALGEEGFLHRLLEGSLENLLVPKVNQVPLVLQLGLVGPGWTHQLGLVGPTAIRGCGSRPRGPRPL